MKACLSPVFLFLLLGVTSVTCLLPLALFSYLPVDNKVVFRADLSVGLIDEYVWDLGDGSDPVTTTTPSLTYYYPKASSWWVQLTVIDRNKRQSSTKKLVLSPANAIPLCSLEVMAINNDEVFLNASKSKDPDGFITQYLWNMGDNEGDVSTNSSILNYIYKEGGSYTVNLTVQDNSKAYSRSCLQKIFVNRPPIAKFDVMSIVDHVAEFNASLSQDFDGSISTYEWNFGDLSPIVVTNKDTVVVTHSYLLSGWYEVSLKVTDNLNNSSVIFSRRILIDIAPNAQFEILSNLDDQLILNAASTWTDNNSSIVNVEWNWGDGGATTISQDVHANVTHIYTIGAYYNVSILVTDNYGKQSGFNQLILVNAKPRASFEVLSIVNDTIQLKTSAIDVDGNLTEISWTFGDGEGLQGEQVEEIEHTYKLGGTYTVCLYATDNLGANNQFCKDLFVNQLPTARLIVASNVDDFVVLQDGFSIDHDGSLVSYKWSWGDGGNDTLLSSAHQTVSHTYTWGDYYNVSLTVVDNLGGQDTASQVIRVNTPPVSEFLVEVLENNTISVDASLSKDIDGVITLYSWNFGEGDDGRGLINKTDSSAFRHFYRLGGHYNITLTVTDNMGDSHTYSSSIFVDTPPFADFEIIAVLDNDWVVVSAKPALTKLIGNTEDIDGQLVSLIWNFGDGSGNVTNQTHTTQTHQYNKAGNYSITLYAQDNNDVFSQKVEKYLFINNPPVANFFIASNEDGVITLNASTSSDRDGAVSVYCWNYGDNTPVNCTKDAVVVVYSYQRSGTYNVSLSVVDDLGTKSKQFASHLVTVNQPPIALFEVVVSSPNGLVTLHSTAEMSKDFDGVVSKYIWDFGDSTSKTITINSELCNTSTVQHLYKTSGFYDVNLQVIDDFGGSDNITFPVVVVIDENLDSSSALDPGSDDFMKQTDVTISSYLENKQPIPVIISWLENRTLHLSAQGSVDLDGKIVSYLWDFGDGVTSNKVIFSRDYPQGGPCNVSLTITDNNGAQATTSKVITINYNPVAFFTFTKVSDLTLQFNASSSFDIDGSISYYNWTFGNGKQLLITTNAAPTLTYLQAGIYNIILGVEDNEGSQSFFSLNVNLSPQTSPPTRLLATSRIPRFASLLNFRSNQYLSFNATHPILTKEKFDDQEDDDNTSYLMLYQNRAKFGSYLIMNDNNGQSLNIRDLTIELAPQSAQTSSFQIYEVGNFYQIVDPSTNMYLAVSSLTNQLELLSTPVANNHLWTIIPAATPAYDNLPLN